MKDNLRKAFADICRGYSALEWNGIVYLKHLSHFEQVDLDECYDKYFEVAAKKKLFTKADRLAWLDKKKLWVRKSEGELATQKAYVENLEKTVKLMFLKSQIDEHKKTINIQKAKYLEMVREKDSLLGLTCEKYAEQKMLNHYIYVSFYKDPELKQRYFTQQEFNELDEEQTDELFGLYIDASNNLSEKNIKKISVSSFFTTYFYVCEDIVKFFDKPVCKLSYNQLNLLYYANYYKQVIQGAKIPDNIREDPDKIDEFAAASNRAKEMLQRRGKDGPVGIVGATNADMEYLGVENAYDPMMKKAMARGGISSIEEAARM